MVKPHCRLVFIRLLNVKRANINPVVGIVKEQKMTHSLLSSDLIASVAHNLTGSYGNECCYKTGGKGSDETSCECRIEAKYIIGMIEEYINDKGLLLVERESLDRIPEDLRNTFKREILNLYPEVTKTFPENFLTSAEHLMYTRIVDIVETLKR